MNSFLDSNIILYLLSEDESKKAIAEDLVTNVPVINSQVLVEVGNVCKKKFNYTKYQITDLWGNLINDCVFSDINDDTVKEAIRLIKRYDFQLFDSIIVSSALQVGCKILYSEDLQHNQLIENRLRIINPFLI